MLVWYALVLSATTVADDTPPGTDLVARVELGKLTPDLRAGWQELEPLFSAWPELGRFTTGVRESWLEVAELVEKASGADLDRRTSEITLVVDADATGGPVWAVVIRGAKPRASETSDFLIDGHPAHRLAERDVAWSIVGDILVAGNERGVQRQVRQVRGARAERTTTEPIQLRAKRLRSGAPLSLVFEAPASVRARLGKFLANVGPIVGAVHGGTMVAKPGKLWLQLSAESGDGQLAIEHGVRAFVALVRASAALLEGGAEALLGLELLDARPKSIPLKLDAPALEGLAEKWLAGFRVDAKIRKRRPQVVEAELSLSSYRGLVAALGVMGMMLVPAVPGPEEEAAVLLELLRRAQLAHRARAGAFLSCGPVPEDLPAGPTPWPAGSCFDAIGFAPPGEVRFQLVSGTEEGELVLMARGDTDGNGDAELWILEEHDVTARPLTP